MTGQPTIALPKPVVVAALSPFGDKIAEALGRRLGQRYGHLPGSCCLVPSTPDPAERIGLELSEVLDIRNATEDTGIPGGDRRRGPLVLALVAACELDDLTGLERFVTVTRREFRRSCLAGTLGLLVYVGSAGGRIPADRLLAGIEEEGRSDIKLVYTDTDARGSRVGEKDAVHAGALFLTYLLEAEVLQESVASLAKGDGGRGRMLTFGVRRADLSEAAVRQACAMQPSGPGPRHPVPARCYVRRPTRSPRRDRPDDPDISATLRQRIAASD